jgi:hypothetical protein
MCTFVGAKNAITCVLQKHARSRATALGRKLLGGGKESKIFCFCFVNSGILQEERDG